MFFHAMKGIIALDIDGTVTAESHTLDRKVEMYLSNLVKEGWGFIFITGRPFQWAVQSLSSLSFPYALAIQNGALLLKMPSREILSRQYLTRDILLPAEKICQDQKTDFIIYSGLENQDWCYYRPAQLPASILSYVLQRSAFLQEKWQPVDSFISLPLTQFLSLKLFAKEALASLLSQRIEQELNLHAPVNRDPFNPEYFVIQATHARATKGHILQKFINLTSQAGPIIAAGDDRNDVSMLKVAHLKVVMANAPAEVLKMADIVAPPADQLGIIQGLREALHAVKHAHLS